MALDMSKYEKMNTAERKLPVIFLINENINDSGKWDGSPRYLREAAMDIMANLNHRGIDAEMAVASFGEKVTLWSGFKKYDKYKREEWPDGRSASKAVFDIGLTLVKDMMEDIDTTPDGNYDPIIILLSSDEVSPGYEDALDNFNEDGRFSNVQKIGISAYYYDGLYYAHNYTGSDFKGFIAKRTPSVLKEFADNKIFVYVSDDKSESWWSEHDCGKLENKDDYTWFCPVLDEIELRYNKDGEHITKKLSGNRLNNDPTRMLSMFGF